MIDHHIYSIGQKFCWLNSIIVIIDLKRTFGYRLRALEFTHTGSLKMTFAHTRALTMPSILTAILKLILILYTQCGSHTLLKKNQDQYYSCHQYLPSSKQPFIFSSFCSSSRLLFSLSPWLSAIAHLKQTELKSNIAKLKS